VRPPIFVAAISWGLRSASVDGGEDHVLQQSGIFGIESRRGRS